MSSRIPLAHRVRHLASFLGLVLPYALGAAAIGTGALIAVGAAEALGNPAAQAGAPDVGGLRAVSDLVRAFFLVFAATLATIGHWAAIIVIGFVHRADYALYRLGGWAPIDLWLLSWLASALLAGAILVVVL